jgi:hypothetical protein
LKERPGESRLVVECDLDYLSAGRSLHEHEYLRSGPRWPGSSPRATFKSPVLPLVCMRPWLSGYPTTMRIVRDGPRDGEDIARDELWRELWWSVALIGAVLTAVSGIAWLTS